MYSYNVRTMYYQECILRLVLCVCVDIVFQDLESSPAIASFSKNGTSLGTAITLESSLSEQTLFPCISTKNVTFSVNFGGDSAWCEVEEFEGYSFTQAASEEHRMTAPQVFVCP